MPRSSTSSSEGAPRRPRLDLVLLVVVAGFLVAELAVRLVDHPTIVALRQERREGYFPPPHVFDQTLGYRYRPDHEGVFERRDYRVTLRTNDHGWRDTDFSRERDPDVWRVALVGSSYLAANQVPIDETWASRLEASLGPVRGKPVELLNFGIDGYRTWNLHQLTTTVVPEYQPDVVIVWSSIRGLGSPDESYRAVDANDVILEARDVRRLDQVLAERNTRLPTFSEALPRMLALTRVLNALLGKEVYANYRFVGGQSATRHDPYALVRGMRDVTQASGARFVLFYLGRERAERDARLFPRGLPHEVLDVPVYRDDGLLPPREQLRFPHDEHWTSEGNRIYAERTRPVFRRLLEEQLPDDAP